MKTRVDIKQFILSIESDFPVNNWKVNEIHLWPLIRIRIFFFLIQKLESQKSGALDTSIVESENPILRKIKSTISRFTSVFQYFRWLNSLPKRRHVFVGFDVHRTNHNGKRYNKFFDPIIEKDGLLNDALVFEFGENVSSNQQHRDLIVRYQNAFPGFRRWWKSKKAKIDIDLAGYDKLEEFLLSHPVAADIGEKSKSANIAALASDFYTRVEFFKEVLRKVDPEQVLFLCYYSNLDEMAMVAAANVLGIKTVEMQHGPQTDIHLCYGNWTVAPSTGYAILPHNFWCWEKQSKSTIDNWNQESVHEAFVGGNPWIDYWKSRSSDYPSNDFILYSLQPNPVLLDEMFPDNIVDIIQESSKKWYLRLHPRQLPQMREIKDFLREKGILEMVEIDAATNDPLPLLLANARLHVTHFSGSAIEAAFFDVFTVLLNEKGQTSFPDLIGDRKAQYLNPRSPDFNDRFAEIVSREQFSK